MPHPGTFIPTVTTEPFGIRSAVHPFDDFATSRSTR